MRVVLSTPPAYTNLANIGRTANKIAVPSANRNPADESDHVLKLFI